LSSIFLAFLLVGCGSTKEDFGQVKRAYWFGPGHAAIEEDARGSVPCIGSSSLVQGSKMWSVCTPNSTFKNGSLLSIEPELGEVRAYWPFSSALPLKSTEGFALLSDGSLGVLYEVQIANQEKPLFAIAIAGKETWVLPPTEIGSFGSLLGFFSVDGGVEAVFSKERSSAHWDASQTVTIAHFSLDGKRQDRELNLACPKEGERLRDCEMLGAYHHKTDKKWHFLVSEFFSHSVFDAPEGGEFLVSKVPDDIGIDINFSLSGLVDSWFSTELLLSAEGLPLPLPESPRGSESLFTRERFRIEDGYMRSDYYWSMLGSQSAQKINGKTLLTAIDKGERRFSHRDDELTVTDATDLEKPKEMQIGPIAGKLFRYHWDCEDLKDGVFIARPQGGFWLLEESGCYVALPSSW
jgi:hypothetical protein